VTQKERRQRDRRERERRAAKKGVTVRHDDEHLDPKRIRRGKQK
jgi:hypothetical protein